MSLIVPKEQELPSIRNALLQGDLSLALQSGRQALEDQPSPDLLHLLAVAEAANGDAEKALGYAQRAFEAEPFSIQRIEIVHDEYGRLFLRLFRSK